MSRLVPRVSILIPAYNAEAWIAGAVQSALQQCRGDIEVIVVDDGSTDETVSVLRAFGNRILLEGGPNRGAPIARNRLLKLASGEWIQYLDADDYLLPNKIIGQLAEIVTDPSVDVIYGPVTVEWHSQSGFTTGLLEIPAPHDPWAQLALWHLPQTGAPLFRRQALLDVGGWREEQPCCQEHELYLRLLMAGKSFKYSDAGGSVYRRFETGTLSTTNMAMVWRERLTIEQRIEHYLGRENMLTPSRQWAINQARFETARSAWHGARDIALEAFTAIRRSGAAFTPGGCAAPAGYRAIYRWLGCSAAEHIADARRLIRRVFA
jgi:glycosyltransferase involved in cell wall biosynthesis